MLCLAYCPRTLIKTGLLSLSLLAYDLLCIWEGVLLPVAYGPLAASMHETMTHCKEGRQPMFWQFTKTFTMSLAILCLVSSLALAQAGGTGGSGGTGAPGSPGGSGGMGTGPGNPGTVPSPGQPSPGVPWDVQGTL